MTPKEYGQQPAFPEVSSVDSSGNRMPVSQDSRGDHAYIESSGGITRREWFAGKALMAFVPGFHLTPKEVAEMCFKQADAMIAASLE